MVIPPPHSGNRPRFHAPVRHYHRPGIKGHVEWDSWVEGSKMPVKKAKIPLKPIMIISTVFVVAAVVTVWMALTTM